MSDQKISVSVVLNGVADFVRQVELMNTRTRQRTIVAIRRGTEAVGNAARSRVKTRTGELKSTIREEFSKDGMVGWVKAGYGILPRSTKSGAMGAARRIAAMERSKKMKAKLVLAGSSKTALSAADLGIYSPVVEFGDKRRNKPRLPFMGPAFQSKKAGILKELKDAPVHAGHEAGL
jgi:hypothetical protein